MGRERSQKWPRCGCLQGRRAYLYECGSEKGGRMTCYSLVLVSPSTIVADIRSVHEGRRCTSNTVSMMIWLLVAFRQNEKNKSWLAQIMAIKVKSIKPNQAIFHYSTRGFWLCHRTKTCRYYFSAMLLQSISRCTQTPVRPFKSISGDFHCTVTGSLLHFEGSGIGKWRG